MFGGNNYIPYSNNMFMQPGLMGGRMYPNLAMTRGIGTLGRGMDGSGILGRGIGNLGRGMGTNALNGASRVGLFGRLRNMNWSNLLTNTGKTLDVINRGIPIVKQTGPMFNNMKTMFRLASAFKDENKKPKDSVSKINNKPKDNPKGKEEIESNISNNATPSFFV